MIFDLLNSQKCAKLSVPDVEKIACCSLLYARKGEKVGFKENANAWVDIEFIQQ